MYVSLGGWRLPEIHGIPRNLLCCFRACFSHTASMQNIDITFV